MNQVPYLDPYKLTWKLTRRGQTYVFVCRVLFRVIHHLLDVANRFYEKVWDNLVLE